MNDLIPYIERYFTSRLTPAEKEQFENRCRSDEAFADEVAFYIAVRGALRSELHGDKSKRVLDAVPDPKVVKLSRSKAFRVALSVAASVLLVILGYFVFFDRPQSSRQLAEAYINQHLMHLSQTMSGSRDSLQLGIEAYNRNDYTIALQAFQDVYRRQPNNRDAKEYTGYVYLVTKKYDQALQQFDELVSMGGRFNRGLFLKAVALMHRNASDDQEQATQLLRQVVTQKSGGSQEAEEWLRKF